LADPKKQSVTHCENFFGKEKKRMIHKWKVPARVAHARGPRAARTQLHTFLANLKKKAIPSDENRNPDDIFL